MQTEKVLKSKFFQSKKENLWNSNQSESSNICSEDISPLNVQILKLSKQLQVISPDYNIPNTNYNDLYIVLFA